MTETTKPTATFTVEINGREINFADLPKGIQDTLGDKFGGLLDAAKPPPYVPKAPEPAGECCASCRVHNALTAAASALETAIENIEDAAADLDGDAAADLDAFIEPLKAGALIFLNVARQARDSAAAIHQLTESY